MVPSEDQKYDDPGEHVRFSCLTVHYLSYLYSSFGLSIGNNRIFLTVVSTVQTLENALKTETEIENTKIQPARPVQY